MGIYKKVTQEDNAKRCDGCERKSKVTKNDHKGVCNGYVMKNKGRCPTWLKFLEED